MLSFLKRIINPSNAVTRGAPSFKGEKIPQYAIVVQLVELLPSKQKVASSSLVYRSMDFKSSFIGLSAQHILITLGLCPAVRE